MKPIKDFWKYNQIKNEKIKKTYILKFLSDEISLSKTHDLT